LSILRANTQQAICLDEVSETHGKLQPLSPWASV